jgi:hypothetical protein
MYQRFVHVAFKLNGLVADISEEVHNDLILRNAINFIGLGNVQVVTGNTQEELL